MRPLVSVVVPILNNSKYLQSALDSVVQTEAYDVEIIIVNDGSTAKESLTIEAIVAKISNAIILHHAGMMNLGVSASRFLGVQYSRGQYIAFLDADDSFTEKKLEFQVDFLEKNNDISFIHTGVNFFGDITENLAHFESVFNNFDGPEDYNHITQRNRICTSSVMVRAEVLRPHMFSLSYYYQYEDWALWTVLLKNGVKGHYLQERLTNYRIHESSATARVLKSSGVHESSHMEYYLSLTLLGVNLFTKIKAWTRIISMLWNRRNELKRSLRIIERPTKETNPKNIVNIMKRTNRSRILVVWGYGSLGKRFITFLTENRVIVNNIVDSIFTSKTQDAKGIFQTRKEFIERGDLHQITLIIATTYYSEVMMSINGIAPRLHDLIILDPNAKMSGA